MKVSVKYQVQTSELKPLHLISVPGRFSSESSALLHVINETEKHLMRAGVKDYTSLTVIFIKE